MKSGSPIRVGVYRLQMFKPSEPFIAEQIAGLPAAQAKLIGRNLFGSADSRFEHLACEQLGKVASLTLALTGYSPAFCGALKHQGLDLVHAHFSIDGLSASYFTKKLGIPLVTTLHGFDVTTSPADFLKSKRPALVRYALFGDRLRRQGAMFIAVSDFIAKKAIEAGFESNKLVRHYMGIDTDRFAPDPSEADGTPTRGPKLLHVARLVEKKGTRHLLEALSRLSKKHPEAQLEIIGDGPLKAELEAQVSALGLGRMVTFTGSVSHATITQRMKSSDLFVLPSVTASNGDSEGLPIVLLEAAACGLPVLSTWHAGIPEAVMHEKTGLLTKEHDVDGLTEALDALLSSAALRQNMGRAARAHVCDHFDIRKQGAALEALYQKML
jgi:colanic acid/amylovoran biosynthesis glycosyltransferase